VDKTRSLPLIGAAERCFILGRLLCFFKPTSPFICADFFSVSVAAFLLDVTNNGGIDIRDDDGDSALHFAAFGRRLPMMEFLISRGADVNAVNGKRCSVLHVSTVMKDSDAVALLLQQPNINVNVQVSFVVTDIEANKLERFQPGVNLIKLFWRKIYSLFFESYISLRHRKIMVTLMQWSTLQKN
jgi:hypothetical protein